jgi:hypothetical protein
LNPGMNREMNREPDVASPHAPCSPGRAPPSPPTKLELPAES